MDENKNNQNIPDQPPTQPAPIPTQPPIQSINPVTIDQTERKPSKWRYFFIVLGILQITGIAIFLLMMIGLSQSASAGASGTEFIAMALFATLVPVVGVVALINIIGLPIYLIKHKPGALGLVFSVISLIISIAPVLYGAFTVYQMVFVVPSLERNTAKSLQKYRQETEKQSAKDNAKPEITKDEAISFMQSCKADYFVGYTDINLVKSQNTKDWLEQAEQSSTGIEISENSPKSYVFASKALTTELQDTARQFRQSCYNTKKLYIRIDNWTETEYPAGTWTKVIQ